MYRKIEISHKTIIFSVFFLIFLWFLFYIKDLLLQLFIALLFTTILDPFVTRLASFKIPRGIAILSSYILILGLLSGIVALLAPPLVEQTTNFANSLPGYISQLGIPPVVSSEVNREFFTRMGSIPGQLLVFGASLLSNVVSVLAVLVFTFYLLLSRNKLDEQLGNFFGTEKTEKIVDLLARLERKLGGWARGELTLMFLVGLLNYIGLTILGMPFALPLAILAGLFEVVPYLGPIVAAIPGVLIGFGISPVTGFGVVIMAILVQQLENYVFVPKIMGKSVGVSPVIILLAFAIGERLAGVVGMIISVPFVITLQVLAQEYLVKD